MDILRVKTTKMLQLLQPENIKENKMSLRKISVIAIMIVLIASISPVFAAGTESAGASSAVVDSTGDKAIAAAIAIGIAAGAGAIGMGLAIARSAEGISRQPEAEGKIRTNLMLGLVFVETAIIYALIVAILIIFVL